MAESAIPLRVESILPRKLPFFKVPWVPSNCYNIVFGESRVGDPLLAGGLVRLRRKEQEISKDR